MKARRLEVGLTQSQLAVAVGISQEGISRVESARSKGRQPELHVAVARALGVSIAWLCGESEDPGLFTPPSQDVPSGLALEKARQGKTHDREGQSPLEAALGCAFDSVRHTLRDLDAVRAVLRMDAPLHAAPGVLTAAASCWLDAAVSLRRHGEAVTVENLLFAVTLGSRSENVP